MRKPSLVVAALLLSGPVMASGVSTTPSHPTRPVSSGGKPVTGRPPTFSKEIVRLLQARCQSCHHEGDIAPFPLVTFGDAYVYRESIRQMVTSRRMPPWKASASCGKFQDDRSLTDAEIQLVERWVASGAPEGNAADLPSPIAFSSDWKGGAPDLTHQMAEAYTPDLSQGDVYRCFVMSARSTEDRWLSGVEVKPGNRAMVHHVLLFLDGKGVGDRNDAADPGPGYACFGGPNLGSGLDSLGGAGGWAPGAAPLKLPDGVGLLVPKGSQVVAQIHYSARTAPDSIGPDRTSVGFTFARSRVTKRFRQLPLVNNTFVLPAGDPHVEVNELPLFRYLPGSFHLLAVAPHMHLLGKSMQVEMTTESGASVCLIDVPEWDFKWQGAYFFDRPVPFQNGGLRMRAIYDNSAGNPEHPTPNAIVNVGWGEQTSDEMALCFVGYTLDSENLALSPESAAVDDPLGIHAALNDR